MIWYRMARRPSTCDIWVSRVMAHMREFVCVSRVMAHIREFIWVSHVMPHLREFKRDANYHLQNPKKKDRMRIRMNENVPKATQKSPIISGSFAKNDLQLKASYGSSPSYMYDKVDWEFIHGNAKSQRRKPQKYTYDTDYIGVWQDLREWHARLTKKTYDKKKK